jgi:hypothetical protein
MYVSVQIQVPLIPLLYGNKVPPEYGRVFHLPWLGPVSLIFTSLELGCLSVSLVLAAVYFQTKYEPSP